MAKTGTTSQGLREAIERAGYYPALVAEAVEAAVGRESVLSYLVHQETTFDSTEAGNIGPVADALVRRLECGFALANPAFPTNGRTVYQGHLFVGSALLNDAALKNLMSRAAMDGFQVAVH